MAANLIFLPTPSARRATQRASPRDADGGISTHALREEGDGYPERFGWIVGYFYPRPPRGGRHVPLLRRRGGGDFYPRPPRGGRRGTAP